jgi:hypothetical protein
MQALRAQSLRRKLREIDWRAGPEVRIVGRFRITISAVDEERKFTRSARLSRAMRTAHRDRDASDYGFPMALVRSKGEGTRAGF